MNKTVINEMRSIIFKVKITLTSNNNNKLGFTLNGNDIVPFYEAVLNNNDHFSLGIINTKILNVIVDDNWIWNVTDTKYNSSLIKFTYHGDKVILDKNTEMSGFWIELASSISEEKKCNDIGWIARSATNSGNFDGYGRIKMC